MNMHKFSSILPDSSNAHASCILAWFESPRNSHLFQQEVGDELVWREQPPKVKASLEIFCS